MNRFAVSICKTLVFLLIPAVALLIWHGTKTAIEIKAVAVQLVLLVVFCITVLNLIFKDEIRIPKDPLLGFTAAYGMIVIGAYWMTQRISLNTGAIIPQLYGILTFFLTAYCFDKRHIKTIASLCTGIGAVAALYGILQYAGLDPLDWMIPDDDLRAQMVSTFGQKNFFAIFLLLILPIGVAATILSKTKVSRSAFLFSTAVMVMALMLSYSRGGVLTFFIVVFVSGALYVFVKIRTHISIRKIGWLLLILPIVMIGSLFILPENIQKDFSELDQGASLRMEWYRGAWKMIERHPLLGAGPGNFATEYVLNKTHKSFAHNPNQVLSHAHNEFLETWVEYGFLGFLALCSIWVCMLYRLVNSLFIAGNSRDRVLLLCLLASVLGYLVYGQFTVATRYVSSTFFFWLIVGLVYLATENKTDSGWVITFKNRLIARPWAAVPIAIVILFMFGSGIRTVVLNFRSDVQLKKAYTYISKNRYDTARQHLNKAISLRPNSIEAYYHRGFVSFQKGDIDNALSDYKKVHGIAPNYVNVAFNLACCYYRKKDCSNTIRMAEHTRRLFPDYDAPLIMLANCYYTLRQPKKALYYCNLLLEKNPKHPNALRLRKYLKSILNSG